MPARRTPSPSHFGSGSDIYCAEDVLDEAGIEIPEAEDDEVEKFREFLDQVNPDDFVTGEEPKS